MLAGLAEAALDAKVGGTVGQLGQMGIQFGAQGLMLKYSRTDESEADAVGAMILYKAAYSPQAMADFFKTLESQGGAPPQWLSDHPNPGNREQAIEMEIKGWPPKNYDSDGPAFQKVRQHSLGVKAYTAEEIAQARSPANGLHSTKTARPLTPRHASDLSTNASASLFITVKLVNRPFTPEPLAMRWGNSDT